MNNTEKNISEAGNWKTEASFVISILLLIFRYLLLAGIFFACWTYAVINYGWFIGLAFGWIPSGIITLLAGIPIAMILDPITECFTPE
ncbi:MAG: hypothetical protein BWX92_03588 [Deltaproteobacteria bacterium ADurb.Bin135]|jgi:hypothetical protein|nr:MAG: hypothetical protein BWX92_03588 [Deltaproteobacteria bacterium ADurb.Bin135]